MRRRPAADRAQPDGSPLTIDQVQAFARFPDQNPNPVFRVGYDGLVLYGNPAAVPILQALGTSVGAPVPADWLAMAVAAAANRQDLEIKAGLTTFALRPVDVPDFGFLNVYGTDVTAQRTIVKFPDQNPHPVFRIDGTGRLLYANRASTDLIEGLGCSVGRTLEAGLLASLLEAVRAGVEGSVEITSLGRDYALLPIDVPEFGFINVYGTDITADNELRRLHRENQRLLLNILPEAIADRLRGGETLIADRFDDVTLLFADIVGFTAMSSAMSPHELVTVLNEVFTVFDELVEQHDLEKVKTIGDAYMVIGGLLDDSKDHTERVGDLALDLSARLEAIEAATRLGVRFRIGINCGPVVAGVIGTKKFIYDVWGDTVNLAARMESLGIPGRIQVSSAVEERLRGRYELEARGLIEVKGKGSLPAFFLVGGPSGTRVRTRGGQPSARPVRAPQPPTGMGADDAGR